MFILLNSTPSEGTALHVGFIPSTLFHVYSTYVLEVVMVVPVHAVGKLRVTVGLFFTFIVNVSVLSAHSLSDLTVTV